MISLKELIKLPIFPWEWCIECNGFGYVDYGDFCPSCKGIGMVPLGSQTIKENDYK